MSWFSADLLPTRSDSIYGPLSAPIVLLIWLYALAIAVLIGAAILITAPLMVSAATDNETLTINATVSAARSGSAPSARRSARRSKGSKARTTSRCSV